MKKQMKRTVYEAPRTEHLHIELEGAFMSGSIVKGTSSEVETTGHELNKIDLTDPTQGTHSWNDDGVDSWQ